MDDVSEFALPPRVVDKRRLQAMVREMNAEIGLGYDPTATAEDSRRLILEDGVKPEDNLFSHAIIRQRYEAK